MVEQSEAEKAKAKWIAECVKNPSEKLYEIIVNVAIVQNQVAEIKAMLEAMNPQATLQRQVMSIAGATVDMNRRLAELEKVKKA